MPAGDADLAATELELLSHPVRLQLLALLGGESEPVCVCDLEGALPVKQPTVSHHLRRLRRAGLVTVERRGTFAYYRANAAAIDGLRARIDQRLASLA